MSFVAIDFETADYGPDSACAVALVRVEGGRIVARECRFIRPPRRAFVFTYIHGITWEDVREEPPFGAVWPGLAHLLKGAEFLAAHNAGFDRSVLQACCAGAGLRPPPVDFRCTVRLARDIWGIYPTRLPDVCRRLRIPLRHHDAASDAEACARIVMAASRETLNAGPPSASRARTGPGALAGSYARTGSGASTGSYARTGSAARRRPRALPRARS